MGAVFEDLTEEEMCDLMCGSPEEDDDMKNYIKSMTNEELATMLRGLITTGISVTTIEREILQEAAERLEKEGEEE